MIVKQNKPSEVRDFEAQDIGGALVLPNPIYCGAPSESNYERQERHHKGVAAD